MIKIALNTTSEFDRYSEYGKRDTKLFRRAVRFTATKLMQQIRKRGKANIRGAGNFKAKHAKGLVVTRPKHKADEDTVINIHMNPFLNRFETGGVIKGAPLLWIPISYGSRKSPGPAGKYPDPLFSALNKRGTPLLVTKKGKAIYFGIESVTEPKLFDIAGIVESEAGKTASYYDEAVATEKSKAQ